MKDACEMSLCMCISEDTVLYLLSMADRYNAQRLKVFWDKIKEWYHISNVFHAYELSSEIAW